MTPLLEIRNLTKTFPVKGGFFGKVVNRVQAVTDVSLSVAPGEVLGLVGESGCGKSTLGRTILKLIEPDSGSVWFEGSEITNFSSAQMRPLRKNIQIIFQDPYSSLNPRLTVGQTLAEPFLIHGSTSRKERTQKVADLLDMVGMGPETMDKYPHEFSGGQRQRVGIARAIALNPKLIIADEPVSALDVSIQAQVINLLADLKEKLGIAMIFIAHDLKVVEHISDRIAVMYLGRVMELIAGDNLVNAKHPYTKALLSAIPVPDPSYKKERVILKGDVPSPLNPPSGCVFHTRCPIAQEVCKQTIPALRPLSDGHLAACHLV